MKVALIGVGQAGGSITERLARFDADAGYGAVVDALAINSASADLESLSDVETLLIGVDQVNGHGVGGDNELGAEIMDADIDQVLEVVDGGVSSRADAVFVVAGLGGGTGSGGAPVLITHLTRVYDVPVFALGIVPGRNEGALYQTNAGRSLKTIAREADATLLVDNDAWHDQGESVADGFDRINDKIARRVGLLLASGEATAGVGESVVDASELLNTLQAGNLAALGYAESVASDDPAQNLQTITSTTRKAVLTGTSLPDATAAASALLVVAGRPDRISRNGVEAARTWLEEETDSMQVRGGDFPRDAEELSALVLLGGIERSDRISSFVDRAREAATADSGADQDPVDQWANDQLDDLL